MRHVGVRGSPERDLGVRSQGFLSLGAYQKKNAWVQGRFGVGLVCGHTTLQCRVHFGLERLAVSLRWVPTRRMQVADWMQ